MTEEVNFWDYATNEYCLDSFICYLLRFEKAKKAFFKLCGIDNEKIQDNGIRQQNKNVDVLIETSNTFLIIEDKVDSTEHDNQLQKYIKAVKKENKGKEIYVCYVKLGFLSEQEKRDITKGLDEIKFPMKNLHFIDLSRLIEIATLVQNDEIIKQWIKEYNPIKDNQENFLKSAQEKYNCSKVYDDVINNENYNKGKNQVEWLRCYLHPYLDTLTEKIRKYTASSELYNKDTFWYVVEKGYTAHIKLKWTKTKKLRNKDCWTSCSLYIMFRKKGPQLVLKQHFYKDKNENDRIGTDTYPVIGLDEIYSKSKDKILGLLSLPKDWRIVSKKNNKDKLMLCKKLLNIDDDLVEVLKAEQNNIKTIFDALK